MWGYSFSNQRGNKVNIVIAGGGFAGWLTALFARKHFPEHNITVIESTEIGILGAGEASTTHLIEVFDFLGISSFEIIKNTDATFKNTVKFSNWSNNKESFFYHPFGYNKQYLSELDGYVDALNTDTNMFHLYAYYKDILNKDYCFANKVSEKKLVFFKKINDQEPLNSIFNYEQFGNWSLNFNAKMLAEYLKKIGKTRKIKCINNKIKEINLNENGDISNFILEDSSQINCDFVFDCTGFARLLIGKKYLSKWISYKKYLPTNKALPFFLENNNNEELPPYIEATAMDYGWMWKTPTQNRYGCGYVFDDNYISVDEAKNEIEKKLGFEVFPPKIFSFDAGAYDEIWIKNCVAIGLSGGFIEPLESTSMMQIIYNLNNFFSHKENILTNNKKIKNHFNNLNKKSSFSIVEYISANYITNKTNTDFWKNFTKNNEIPENIKNILTINEERLIRKNDFDSMNKVHFFEEDYMCLLFGHQLINKKHIKPYEEILNNFENRHKVLINEQDKIILDLVSHKKILEDIMKG